MPTCSTIHVCIATLTYHKPAYTLPKLPAPSNTLREMPSGDDLPNNPPEDVLVVITPPATLDLQTR